MRLIGSHVVAKYGREGNVVAECVEIARTLCMSFHLRTPGFTFRGSAFLHFAPSLFHDGSPACADIQCGELLRGDGVTEGAEAEVFSTLPDAILNQCRWIVGEFHDHTGFEVLARLAPHFHLDLKKKMFRSRFRFHACNLSKVQQLSRSDLDALQR
jgi:hypothetical protein